MHDADVKARIEECCTAIAKGDASEAIAAILWNIVEGRLDNLEQARAAYEKERDWLDDELTKARSELTRLREGLDLLAKDGALRPTSRSQSAAKQGRPPGDQGASESPSSPQADPRADETPRASRQSQ